MADDMSPEYDFSNAIRGYPLDAIQKIKKALKWVEPLRAAVEELVYKDWLFTVHDEPYPYLQITFYDASELQYCRKWMLYPTMDASEIVRTAWMAVMAAEEHEAREHFKYKGRRLFGPHFDADALAEFTNQKKNLSITDDPK